MPLEGGSPLLPLSESVKKIALIGPLADNSGEMTGSWGGDRKDPDVVTVKDALEARAKKIGGSVTYAKGTEILGESDAGFAEAIEAAKQADVAVLALGESSEMSGEAGSRAHLDLPGNQEKLLEAVAATGGRLCCWSFQVGRWCWTGRRNTFPQLWRLVSGNRSGLRDCRFAVWRCCVRAESCR